MRMPGGACLETYAWKGMSGCECLKTDAWRRMPEEVRASAGGSMYPLCFCDIHYKKARQARIARITIRACRALYFSKPIYGQNESVS